MKKPTVSIVIRTLNEEKYLEQLLSKIYKQKTSYLYEIILIDSGSTDNTLKIARNFNCKILNIDRNEFSFGRSLNIACDKAEGKYLAFISGHCIPKNEQWLDALIKPLSCGVVQYTYGRQIGGNETYWSESQIFKKYFPGESSIPQTGFYCNNANSAIEADTWKKYRFNEELTGLEDMHLAKRLVSNDGKIGYIAEACVLHLHHETWPQIRRRFEREAIALKHIYPELILRKRDFWCYFVNAVVHDINAGLPMTLNAEQFKYILKYRYNQYKGSYVGSKSSRVSMSRLRNIYFYPSSSKEKL